MARASPGEIDWALASVSASAVRQAKRHSTLVIARTLCMGFLLLNRRKDTRIFQQNRRGLRNREWDSPARVGGLLVGGCGCGSPEGHAGLDWRGFHNPLDQVAARHSQKRFVEVIADVNKCTQARLGLIDQ